MGDVQGFIDSLVPVVESPYKYYTVRIDLNNPDPETSCEYMDDAVGMTPGYDGWKDTNLISGIRPCLLNYQDGTVQYQEKDVSAYASSGSGETYDDYMVEFPLMGYKLWNDDSYQYVSVTDDPNAQDKGYCYYAHSLNTEKDCDKIYIGQFLGTTTTYADRVTRLRSLYEDYYTTGTGTSLTPLINTSLTDFRTYASNTGSGYSLISFFPWTLLQCLYMIIYKNLNSQAALGQGYISDANIEADILGTTLSQPFCYGDPNDGINHVKFLGIEDFYGNLYSWLDGVYINTIYNILTDYRNSQFTGSGHDFQFNAGQVNKNFGFISKILGNNTDGFIPVAFNGSESTYFADLGQVYSGSFGYCGGYWNDGAYAGAFCLFLSSSASFASSAIGARLMYKHLASSGGGSNS